MRLSGADAHLLATLAQAFAGRPFSSLEAARLPAVAAAQEAACLDPGSAGLGAFLRCVMRKGEASPFTITRDGDRWVIVPAAHTVGAG